MALYPTAQSPHGAVSEALRLFFGMRDDLDDRVNFEEQSKTALALPPKA